ncbi:hypothetical protein [Vallitalea okinawensis]|uniref:hypothetical protein n=1 Tax=Vallitalea okinawensis TaxID=2078660 RepID=UPI000CFC1625|nr:hypothetical protein [Vallitalea okinawensis]
MAKKNKPTVVKDGVNFEQFKSDVAPKEVDVVESAEWLEEGDTYQEEHYEEEHYEDQQQLNYHKDYNANKNLKR